MLDFERLKAEALEVGFSHAAPLDASTIQLREDVRAMCSANSCGAYGSNWSCPPACGEIEDSFDAEGIMEAQARHKEHFSALHEQLIGRWPNLLALSAGICTRCKQCTYPDAPCRFPQKRFSSMEAYGILVTDACRANGLAYYYGPGTIAYTSCFLLV